MNLFAYTTYAPYMHLRTDHRKSTVGIECVCSKKKKPGSRTHYPPQEVFQIPSHIDISTHTKVHGRRPSVNQSWSTRPKFQVVQQAGSVSVTRAMPQPPCHGEFALQLVYKPITLILAERIFSLIQLSSFISRDITQTDELLYMNISCLRLPFSCDIGFF